MIRLTVPSIEEDDLEAVRAALASGHLVQGARVAAFEAAVGARVGSRFTVAVTNCTAALQLALLALDVGPGDLVLVTAYSWLSTANVVELCGAQPVFVDIDAATFNMDPRRLDEALERLTAAPDVRRRVKAVLPVHTFGQMADMDALLEVAGRYGLPVIEDAACALGATLGGRQAGSVGTLGCFSFHPRKAITTGEGGVATTDDPKLAKRIRALRNHGQDPDAATPDFVTPGFNCRMTELQAALGVTQMAKLDRVLAARRRLAARYDELFAGTPVLAPRSLAGTSPTYQSYVVLLPRADAAARAHKIKRLRDDGVETTIGTWHMPLTSYYRARYGHAPGDFPVTDDIFARALTLPLYESLSEHDQSRVVEQVLRAD